MKWAGKYPMQGVRCVFCNQWLRWVEIANGNYTERDPQGGCGHIICPSKGKPT
jgi:hypothetical protein